MTHRVQSLLQFLLQLLIGVGALALAPGRAAASNYALEEIPSTVPAKEAQRLKAAGVTTTFALLEKAGDPESRKALAKETKIPQKTLDGWVQLADLMRVKGIGPEVARLLTAAGAKTVASLKSADATKLNDDISKANSSQHLSDNPPALEQLQAWIAQAKTLPIVLH
jgi:predicted flap endonuclease-1-like 5' DNA nuclease